MLSGRHIFFAPLDWGLGHATRSVPLIRKLSENNRVTIGMTPGTAVILREEFPDAESIQLPSYDIHYARVIPPWAGVIMRAGSILRVRRSERTALERIIAERKIDIVISDSRYGLFSEKAQSILITHQLFLRTPFANSIAQAFNRSWVSRFSAVWVPDYADERISLSGGLSHGEHYHHDVNYIGPQSRLSRDDTPVASDFLFLLSGPEPHRTAFERAIREVARRLPGRKILVRGTADVTDQDHDLIVHDLPSRKTLSQLLTGATTVVCRSGYSTLMDLHHIRPERCVLVPTPGQPEQEYLAEYWEKKFGSRRVKQKDLQAAF
jgi:hypothetical protein